MQLSLELLKNHYKIECGSVYGGKIFAKDGSPHKAVVFYVSKETEQVYTFCITSKEKTIKRFEEIDCKNSVVVLPVDVVKSLYNDEEPSWVYCGKANMGKLSIDDFFAALSEQTITPYKKLSDTLFAEIVLATKASNTYSEDDLKEIGLLKTN